MAKSAAVRRQALKKLRAVRKSFKRTRAAGLAEKRIAEISR